MVLVLGSRLVLVRSKLELVLVHSKLVLVQVQGSKQVLALELGSILALARSMLGPVLDSSLELAHSNHCHDDGEDLLQPLEQIVQPQPKQPERESQTSWSTLLITRNQLWANWPIYFSKKCRKPGEPR